MLAWVSSARARARSGRARGSAVGGRGPVQGHGVGAGLARSTDRDVNGVAADGQGHRGAGAGRDRGPGDGDASLPAGGRGGEGNPGNVMGHAGRVVGGVGVKRRGQGHVGVIVAGHRQGRQHCDRGRRRGAGQGQGVGASGPVLGDDAELNDVAAHVEGNGLAGFPAREGFPACSDRGVAVSAGGDEADRADGMGYLGGVLGGVGVKGRFQGRDGLCRCRGR